MEDTQNHRPNKRSKGNWIERKRGGFGDWFISYKFLPKSPNSLSRKYSFIFVFNREATQNDRQKRSKGNSIERKRGVSEGSYPKWSKKKIERQFDRKKTRCQREATQKDRQKRSKGNSIERKRGVRGKLPKMIDKQDRKEIWSKENEVASIKLEATQNERKKMIERQFARKETRSRRWNLKKCIKLLLKSSKISKYFIRPNLFYEIGFASKLFFPLSL